MNYTITNKTATCNMIKVLRDLSKSIDALESIGLIVEDNDDENSFTYNLFSSLTHTLDSVIGMIQPTPQNIDAAAKAIDNVTEILNETPTMDDDSIISVLQHQLKITTSP
ncbi:hypothetical protein J6A31_06000 [bacterium]|nr:hypothetical protein [bacterium]